MKRGAKTRGFTLIELLIVLAIISLLASVIVVDAQAAHQKANDSARLANLNAMRVALRLYAQANGAYPDTTCSGSGWIGYGGYWAPHQACQGIPSSPTGGTLETLLAPYLSQPPTDPTNTSSEPGMVDAGYLYTGNGTDYCIMAYKLPQNMYDFPQSTWNMAPGRCGSVNAAGQCSGANSVYYAQGPTWAGGC